MIVVLVWLFVFVWRQFLLLCVAEVVVLSLAILINILLQDPFANIIITICTNKTTNKQIIWTWSKEFTSCPTSSILIPSWYPSVLSSSSSYWQRCWSTANMWRPRASLTAIWGYWYVFSSQRYDIALSCMGTHILPGSIPLTHERLVDFISNEFNLKKFGISNGDRIGVCLPQGRHQRSLLLWSTNSRTGPELVVCILSTVTYCACVPINPAGTLDEIKFELKNVGCKAVILPSSNNTHIVEAAADLGMSLLCCLCCWLIC